MDIETSKAIKRLDERIKGKQSRIQMLISHYKTLQMNQIQMEDTIKRLLSRVQLLENIYHPKIDEHLDMELMNQLPPW